MHIDDYYEQQGRGSPIVFIHGSYATTSTWKRMIERLAFNHHCIAIKLPGHCGTSDPKDFSSPSVRTELDIIERIIKKLTDKPFHLVGHSYGGVVALACALRRTITLSQLTLFEPVAVWVLVRTKDVVMTATVQNFLANYFDKVANNVPDVCGEVIDFWGGEGAFAALPAFIKESMGLLVANNVRHWGVCMSIESTLNDLQSLTTPTQLVCGTESNAVAQAIVNQLNKTIPLCKKYSIQGASHFLVTSHVDECIAVIESKL